MSATYGLYDLDEKEWIDLGKKISSEKFQMPTSRIFQFLNDRQGNHIVFISDITNTPDENGRWRKVDEF